MRPSLFLLCVALGLVGCGESTQGRETAAVGTEEVPTKPGRTVFETSADVVGRWTSSSLPSEVWIAFRDDGRYRYSGFSSAAVGTAVPGTDVSGTGGSFPWMTAHTGTWTWQDGDLELTPDDEKVRSLLPFEFDADEGSLNLRVVGRGPTGPRWIVFWQDGT